MRYLFCVVWAAPTIESHEARFFNKQFFTPKNGFNKENQNKVFSLKVGECLTLGNEFIFITRIK